MAFKLTVGEFIEVPVKGALKDGSRDVQFSFVLTAKRIPIAEYRAALGEDSVLTVREFLQAYVTGWRDQRLVVDDAGQSAPFGAEAFEVLLSLVGMEQTVLGAYLRALQVSDTSAGKAKN